MEVQSQLNEKTKKKEIHIDKVDKRVEVKQNAEEILLKYEQLQHHLVAAKQIYIEDVNLKEYLKTFYGKMETEMREMQPISET